MPVVFAVFGVFKGVQIFFGHGFLPPCILGEGIKNTHPLKDQGWDTKYSTVPPWLPCMAEPLIDAITGAPGVAFPPTRLGSGIDGGRGSGAFQRRGSLSGDLTGIACLRHSLYRCNLAHLRRKVNPKPGLRLPETGANHNFFPARKAETLRQRPIKPAFFLRKEGQNQKQIDRTRGWELT